MPPSWKASAALLISSNSCSVLPTRKSGTTSLVSSLYKSSSNCSKPVNSESTNGPVGKSTEADSKPSPSGNRLKSSSGSTILEIASLAAKSASISSRVTTPSAVGNTSNSVSIGVSPAIAASSSSVMSDIPSNCESISSMSSTPYSIKRPSESKPTVPVPPLASGIKSNGASKFVKSTSPSVK